MLLSFLKFIGYDADVDYRNRISYMMIALSVSVSIMFLTIYLVFIPFAPAIMVHFLYIAFNLFLIRCLKKKHYTGVKYAIVISFIIQLSLAVFLWFPVETGYNLYYFMVPMATFQFTFYENKQERYFSVIASGIITLLYFVSAVYPMDYYLYDPGTSMNQMLRALTIMTLIPPMTFMFIKGSKDQHKMQKELNKLANTDALTSVMNRRALFDHGAEEFELARKYGHEFTLIVFDIDYFKTVNDQYGHPAGDAVLIQLTDLIKKSMRKEDVFARYGGEEFAVITRKTTLATGQTIAQKLHKKIESYGFIVEKKVLSMTVSVGVVQYKTTYKDFDTMMRDADKALYVAKESGRNRIVTSIDH